MKKRGMSIAFVAAACAIVLAAIIPRAKKADGQDFPVLLQITSPTEGTVASPGQTVTVVVTPNPGVTPSAVWLSVPPELSPGLQGLSAPPFQFSLPVPTSVFDAGNYPIRALGIIGPGQGASANPVDLDVEPSSSISITSLKVSPLRVDFTTAGQNVQFHVQGAFSDGSGMNLTNSTQINYTSSDPTIATVSNTGLVTAATSTNRGVAVILTHFANINNGITTGVTVTNTKIPPSQ